MPNPGSRFQKFMPGLVKFFFISFCTYLYIYQRKNQKNKKIKQIKKESGALFKFAGGRAPLTLK